MENLTVNEIANLVAEIKESEERLAVKRDNLREELTSEEVQRKLAEMADFMGTLSNAMRTLKYPESLWSVPFALQPAVLQIRLFLKEEKNE